MSSEDIRSRFSRLEYEDFFPREYIQRIEMIHHPQEDNPQYDRVKCRKYPYIDDDQSWYRAREYKPCSQIDEGNIEKKPEKRSIDHFPKEFYDRCIGSVRIESSIREYQDPKEHSKYNKWIELILTNIRDTELDKWYPVSDRSEKIAREKESDNT